MHRNKKTPVTTDKTLESLLHKCKYGDYADEHVSGGVDNRWFSVIRDVPLR